ncbi:2,4-dienoyl-CoA reductase [NADPH] [Gemmata obscuriglobus]|uniref:NADH:flavin oxidoreductase n=1 Tax=Gemmata obscuriglobus TaxID=114 RepID=A0A2Z3GU42_9BACT|nr:NADH:flavin oxidoreductase [Gemmata obscuriglobus]AWM35582.1 NADH:flavin oxidoreductase [Gemmata obscuriglobus]QEG31896.1 2,4-dienoyl-CoA reductase [NADPH] [Gemmata obscuriglobus]VTS11242.1 nadh:flavin oxidoreductase : NADH:flavin oxidoreductase/NADH oxidase OS=Isosphaera pallida (strain ATCC 43644 / DSM 9630 / IS1B) GN=Isop_1740 PE=4 SV=1: Oxidored_FMN [Gemmata obscuriglobus UQM 2246]
MAKFFKYKSVADLEAENARLGTDLRFSDDLAPLFRPIAVGPRTAGNRWCVHPMEGCDGEPDGAPGPLTFRRYARFGAGGAKLIWGEACAVTPGARANPRQIVLNPNTKPHFARIVEECRAAHRGANGTDSDLLFGLQLTHSGRYSHPHPIIATHDPVLDPRTVANKATGEKVTADYPLITDDELKRLVDDYVATAKLAVEVGFDFVDVKQCHRYLLNELLGARNRPGPYGGSYENRTRFAREVIQAVRAAVPAHVVVATRMNLFDGIPFHKGEDDAGAPDAHALPLVNGWGMSETEPFAVDLTEPLRWIGEMRALGVTLVNATMGNPYAQPHYGRPFEYPPPDGYESPEHPLIGVDRHFRAAATVQAAYPDLALVGTGYSYLQEFLPQAGAANVRDGRINIVGVGRATLSQPDWVRQLLDTGKLDRKRVCRTFSYCTALMRTKQHPLGQYETGCPPFDKEAYGDVWKEVQQLHVKKA